MFEKKETFRPSRTLKMRNMQSRPSFKSMSRWKAFSIGETVWMNPLTACSGEHDNLLFLFLPVKSPWRRWRHAVPISSARNPPGWTVVDLDRQCTRKDHWNPSIPFHSNSLNNINIIIIIDHVVVGIMSIIVLLSGQLFLTSQKVIFFVNNNDYCHLPRWRMHWCNPMQVGRLLISSSTVRDCDRLQINEFQ